MKWLNVIIRNTAKIVVSSFVREHGLFSQMVWLLASLVNANKQMCTFSEKLGNVLNLAYVKSLLLYIYNEGMQIIVQVLFLISIV